MSKVFKQNYEMYFIVEITPVGPKLEVKLDLFIFIYIHAGAP